MNSLKDIIIASKSTFNTILGYLNNIAQYCNLEDDIDGCTSCHNASSEIYSYPDSSHLVLDNFLESTDQNALDAIRCVDTLDLKVSSFPYNPNTDNPNPFADFLNSITTQSFVQDCPYTNTALQPITLNQKFLLGYATQFGLTERLGHCGEGFINTYPCFDDHVGNITATIFDLTYCNTPDGYLETIAPKGLQIEQYSKINAQNPTLKVYQGVYFWNHRYSYWFGGTCGYIDGDCIDPNNDECSPCFIKTHPYDQITSAYRCNGDFLSPPACSSNLPCPPFTEGVVNWKFSLNPRCYDAKEFIRKRDGNVKVLFITYSNIENSTYDVLYNKISAKPNPDNWFAMCDPCIDGSCTVTVLFKTYIIPDKLIAFYDNDGDGLYTEGVDDILHDSGFISTGSVEWYELKLTFSSDPQTDEYDIKDICKLQFCVIGNDDPNTIWDIRISGCHFEPDIVASGGSGGFCTMLFATSDEPHNTPEITTDGVPSGIVVSPSDDSDDQYDSENPFGTNQETITCYSCYSGNCSPVGVQVIIGETCEDYGLYTSSSTCNEECISDGDGSGTGSGGSGSSPPDYSGEPG